MIDGFHKKLHARIVEAISDKNMALIQTSSGKSLDEVALHYTREVSAIAAYQSVLALCVEVENEIYGDQSKRALSA